jgi:small-conductance mechanosensitive channel
MVSNPLTDPDWAKRSVDVIDRFVQLVRNYTTKPLVYTARGVVYGFIALFGIIATLVLVLVGTMRGLNAAFDAAFERDKAVWITYLVLGGVLLIIGFLLMRRRFADDDTK